MEGSDKSLDSTKFHPAGGSISYSWWHKYAVWSDCEQRHFAHKRCLGNTNVPLNLVVFSYENWFTSGNSARLTWFAQLCLHNKTRKSPTSFFLSFPWATFHKCLLCFCDAYSDFHHISFLPFLSVAIEPCWAVVWIAVEMACVCPPLPSPPPPPPVHSRPVSSQSLCLFSLALPPARPLYFTPPPHLPFSSFPFAFLHSLKSNSLATSCGVSTRKGRQPPCGATATRCNIRQPVQRPTLLTRNSQEEVGGILPVKGGIADDVRERKRAKRMRMAWTLAPKLRLKRSFWWRDVKRWHGLPRESKRFWNSYIQPNPQGDQ